MHLGLLLRRPRPSLGCTSPKAKVHLHLGLLRLNLHLARAQVHLRLSFSGAKQRKKAKSNPDPSHTHFPSAPSTVLPPYALPSRRAALSDRIRSVKLNPFIGALARNKEAEPMCGGLPCHRLFLSLELPCGSLRRDMPHTSTHWGLNPGPSVYKTDALPLSYRGAHLTAQTDLQWFLFKRIRSEAIQH